MLYLAMPSVLRWKLVAAAQGAQQQTDRRNGRLQLGWGRWGCLIVLQGTLFDIDRTMEKMKIKSV